MWVTKHLKRIRAKLRIHPRLVTAEHLLSQARALRDDAERIRQDMQSRLESDLQAIDFLQKEAAKIEAEAAKCK